MQDQEMVERAAKALNLKITRQAPPKAVWISRVDGAELLFDSLENPRDTLQLLEELRIEIQWAYFNKHLCVRCRVQGCMWPAFWHRKWEFKKAVTMCAARHQLGEDSVDKSHY